MMWALQHEQQVAQALDGGLSPRISTYSVDDVASIPYMKAFSGMWGDAMSKPTIPESDRITEVMTLRLSQLVAGEMDVDSALDEVALEIKEILGDQGTLKYPPKDPS